MNKALGILMLALMVMLICCGAALRSQTKVVTSATTALAALSNENKVLKKDLEYLASQMKTSCWSVQYDVVLPDDVKIEVTVSYPPEYVLEIDKTSILTNHHQESFKGISKQEWIDKYANYYPKHTLQRE